MNNRPLRNGLILPRVVLWLLGLLTTPFAVMLILSPDSRTSIPGGTLVVGVVVVGWLILISAGVALIVFDFVLRAEIEAYSASRSSTPIPNPVLYQSPEMQWFNKNYDLIEKEYPGEWLAVEGERIIAHSYLLDEVLNVARMHGVDKPFVIATRPKHLQDTEMIV